MYGLIHWLVSAVIHGIIYAIIWKAVKHLDLLQTIGVGVGLIGLVVAGGFVTGHLRISRIKRRS